MKTANTNQLGVKIYTNKRKMTIEGVKSLQLQVSGQNRILLGRLLTDPRIAVNTDFLEEKAGELLISIDGQLIPANPAVILAYLENMKEAT